MDHDHDRIDSQWKHNEIEAYTKQSLFNRRVERQHRSERKQTLYYGSGSEA